ncbi:MAG: c-type cytochrome [Gemmataceae bacterium]|nr:c-type cytochrome [Gemmataceae bacterium]
MKCCKTAFLTALTAWCLVIWSAPVAAQKSPLNDLSDDPEVARQLMQLPEGFEVQLVASEPTVINPIQINFDARGRLYVLCVPRYPQILPGQAPNDYVVMLDDFDKTGKARRSRVVVDGLMVPTGMMPGDGGVYVGQAESLLHFREGKGTGKFGDKRIVLSGFGTADTHHTLNTFRWGPDSSLYFNQGVYIHSTVETPYGPRQLFGGCIWQLRTDRLKLEVFDRSILPNNTWGHAFDAWGQSFIASAWPGALNVVLPDSPLHKNTQQELVPPLKMTQIGAERHCGLEIVSGRHLPDDWQGNLLTGDFLSHRVYRYAMTDDGQRFHAKPLPPLVVSKHRKFRPIDIKMGPDGAIYIADLYQQIIQHNQVDFRDPRRDHTRGRIWRVVRKDRPLLEIPKLFNAPIEQVLDHLKAPEQWTRLNAKRTLAERDRKTVAPALAKWVNQLDPKDADLQRHLLEALWTYQAIDQVDEPLLLRAMRSEDARLRAAATRVLGAWHDRVPDAIRLLGTQAADANPRVRLEVVGALNRIPSAQAVSAGMRALDATVDPLLEFSLQKLAILHKPLWYPEFQAGRLTFDGNARHTAFALKAIRGDAVPTLVGLLVKNKVPPENRAEVLQLVALLGKAEDQSLALREMVEGSQISVTDRSRVAESLAQAARERKVQPTGDLDRIAIYFSHENARLASAAIRLAGVWKLEAQRERLNEWASNPKADDQRREAAVSALVDLGGKRSIAQLARLSAEGQPYEVRQQAIAGLTMLHLDEAARHAGDLLGKAPPPGKDPSNLFAAFLARKDGSQSLAKILHQQQPATDSAKIGLRVLVERGVIAVELQLAMQKAAGKIGEKRQLDAVEMKRWIALVQSQGDPARGEAVFRRSTLGCYQCHALGGAGGRVGPDLSAIGTSAQLDYLIESILLPSKVVREGYTTAHVTTKDGRTFSGILHRESAKEVVLKDPIRDEVVIGVSDIDEKRVGGSLMPDGLDQSLTDAELADLFRFLAELGKPGPYSITHRLVARRWEFAPDENASGWKPIYAKVSGHLPLGETFAADHPTTAARCQVDVVTAGKIALHLNDIQGITLRLDGKAISPQPKMSLELARGVHTLIFSVDRRVRKDLDLRLELAESAGAMGQARFVDGR